MKFQLLRTIIDTQAKRVGMVRMALLFIPFAGVMLLVALGMARYQIDGPEKFVQEAQSNMACDVPMPPVRGDITDRNGVLLATDNSDMRILRIQRNCNWEELQPPGHDPFAGMTTRKYAALDAAGRQRLLKERFIRISHFIERGDQELEVFTQIVPHRIYLRDAAISPVLGYMGEIDERDLKLFRHRGYRLGDRVGKAGVERRYESVLTGARGQREILIDAAGRYLTERRTLYPTRGPRLKLSIDMRLQQVAYNAFHNNKRIGGAVFMDVRTGEILAIVSSPSFSPKPGIDGLTPLNWSRLVMDPDKPLMNRAIASHLPLGSVFKLVVATGALEQGVATARSVFHCPGYFMIPGRQSYPPRCYTAHGAIGFINGISQSCDVVFYILGQKLGVVKINYYARMMGLGGKTGIDLPGESVGLIPDEYWKRRFGDGREWNAGDTINLSIGQGDVQITPIQVARMVNIFASRGLLVTPHVASTGKWPAIKLPFKASTLETVRQGMRGAVTSGTCRRMSDFPFPVAAKTGTAETGTRTAKKKSHSWFAGFVPFDKPIISFAVFVEHGGYGAEAALPTAREVLDKALELGYFGPVPKDKK